jgi:hypothetical protein
MLPLIAGGMAAQHLIIARATEHLWLGKKGQTQFTHRQRDAMSRRKGELSKYSIDIRCD